MQYIGILPTATVYLLFIMVMIIEILGEKNKREFFKFKSPLYYSISRIRKIDVMIMTGYVWINLIILIILLVYLVDAKFIPEIGLFWKNINDVEANLLS